jgi:hypothetical protein
MNRLLAERKVPMHYGPEELAEDLQHGRGGQRFLAAHLPRGNPALQSPPSSYSHVLIPEAVRQEITRAPAFAAAASFRVAADARDAGWLQVTSAANRPLVKQLETVLDLGEAEAIAVRSSARPSGYS